MNINLCDFELPYKVTRNRTMMNLMVILLKFPGACRGPLQYLLKWYVVAL